ncbi:hypothetical protein KM043_006577 [Ampulex compressa]|nr:hypothetical protein KM043_006577 [Ampulex compressa]
MGVSGRRRYEYLTSEIIYQRYGRVLQGSQTHGWPLRPREKPQELSSNRGTSESRELQLPQLAASLFLIRILIKFNTHGALPVRGGRTKRAEAAIDASAERGRNSRSLETLESPILFGTDPYPLSRPLSNRDAGIKNLTPASRDFDVKRDNSREDYVNLVFTTLWERNLGIPAVRSIVVPFRGLVCPLPSSPPARRLIPGLYSFQQSRQQEFLKSPRRHEAG